MWFALWSTGVQVWLMWILSWRFVGWTWTWQASISGMVQWASVCGWSVVWSMWSVMVRSMAITPVCGIGNVVSYSCDDGNYPYVVILSGLYRCHGGLSCNVCDNMVETLNGFTCPFPHSSVWNLIWCGDFYVVWAGDALLGFPKEESYVGNPLWCDHPHHIQNT